MRRSAGGGAGAEGRRAEARELLRRHWGYAAFRPLQRPVLRAMLAGRDLLAVLPTGAGKSVCFQVPALLEPGLTLVISPLVALMEDQVAGLRARGLPAAALTGATDRRVRSRTLREVAAGRLRLLYSAPERLGSSRFLGAVGRARVSRLVVDEAHCISEWGHDFRPAYRRIRALYPLLDRPPVAAFTATATPATRADVEACLELADPVLLVTSPDRPNLWWGVRREEDRDAAALAAVGEVATRPGAALVYVSTRRGAVLVAEALRRRGVRAAPYHAGLPDRARGELQARFLGGELRAVAATTAFGMGVDHPRIRTVCHAGSPASLEAYVQQAGRAGRDGERARCLLFAHSGDLELQRRLLRRSWPPASLARAAWRALEPGRTRTLGAVRRRLGRRRPAAEVEAALRLLARFDLAREREGGWVRAPGPLAGRFRPAVCRRGRRRGRWRLREMDRYVRARGCRRAVVADHFGVRRSPCGGCDRCDARRGADPETGLAGTAGREHES